MWPDRVSNPGPLTSQVPYRLRYTARRMIVGQGPIAPSVGAGGPCLESLKKIFSSVNSFRFLSL